LADTGTNGDVAAVLFGHHLLGDQFLLDALGVGVRACRSC
jgi:hypothetical protein